MVTRAASARPIAATMPTTKALPVKNARLTSDIPSSAVKPRGKPFSSSSSSGVSRRRRPSGVAMTCLNLEAAAPPSPVIGDNGAGCARQIVRKSYRTLTICIRKTAGGHALGGLAAFQVVPLGKRFLRQVVAFRRRGGAGDDVAKGQRGAGADEGGVIGHGRRLQVAGLDAAGDHHSGIGEARCTLRGRLVSVQDY